MEFVGWGSSAILAATIIHQVWQQWKDKSAAGVSIWLFIGQCLANAGFIAYSLSQRDWVFTFTNGLLLLTNLVGFALTRHQHRKEEHAAV